MTRTSIRLFGIGLLLSAIALTTALRAPDALPRSAGSVRHASHAESNSSVLAGEVREGQ
jgi:hypothetical protein